MIDELTRSFQQDAEKAEARVAVLEQTVKMLMRELAQRRPGNDYIVDRRLESTLTQARRALVGEEMP